MIKLLLALLLSIASVSAAESEDLVDSTEHRKDQVTMLDLSHKKLTDIEFIKDYPNLRELNLSWNYFSTIAPLVNLKKLEKLNLYVCSIIQDLELLGQITSLKSLNIGSIYTNDEINYPPLDFVKSLKNLEEIDISHNARLYKINPLAILPKLSIVHLVTGYSASIEDWFSLNHFFTLKELTIYKEDIRRFPALEGVNIKFA